MERRNSKNGNFIAYQKLGNVPEQTRRSQTAVKRVLII